LQLDKTLRPGDLVGHLPSKSNHPAMVKIYADWGHEPDFRVGIILETKDSFALVLPCRSGVKPAWYQDLELEVISECG